MIWPASSREFGKLEALAPGNRSIDRARPDSNSRPHPLQPVDDDLLAAGEAVLDDHVGPALALDLDAPHDRLAVLDKED